MPSAFPGPLEDFVRLFNQGSYWESHEVLEGPWRVWRSEFYHGLILYASAFVHAQRRNPRGVQAQLRKAERALSPYRPHYLGLDVESLLAHAARVRELAAEGSLELGAGLMVLDAALLRGVEFELAQGS